MKAKGQEGEMEEKERDRVLLAMALVVDAATSLSLDSADDRRELKRRLGEAVLQASQRVPRVVVLESVETTEFTGLGPHRFKERAKGSCE